MVEMPVFTFLKELRLLGKSWLLFRPFYSSTGLESPTKILEKETC